MALVYENFILELIVWNSFVPSMSLVSSLFLPLLYFTPSFKKVGTKFTI